MSETITQELITALRDMVDGYGRLTKARVADDGKDWVQALNAQLFAYSKAMAVLAKVDALATNART